MVDYKSASYTMAGTACLVIILNILFWRLGVDEHSLVPGFGFAAGLATPALCAWLGIVIKQWIGVVNRWFIVLLSVVGLTLLCVVATNPNFFSPDKFLWESLAMLILGFIIPAEHLETFSKKNMLVPSILLCAASILIYTCIAVVRNRVFIYPVVDGYSDMKNLSLTLLQVSEVVSAFVAVYFVIAVSFSSVGIAFGSQKWVRVILAICCVIAFVRAILNACIAGEFRSIFIIQALVNPVFFYLVSWITKGQRKEPTV